MTLSMSGRRELRPSELNLPQKPLPLPNQENGQRGIRTHGKCKHLRRFSKPLPSTARPSVLEISPETLPETSPKLQLELNRQPETLGLLAQSVHNRQSRQSFAGEVSELQTFQSARIFIVERLLHSAIYTLTSALVLSNGLATPELAVNFTDGLFFSGEPDNSPRSTKTLTQVSNRVADFGDGSFSHRARRLGRSRNLFSSAEWCGASASQNSEELVIETECEFEGVDLTCGIN